MQKFGTVLTKIGTVLKKSESAKSVFFQPAEFLNTGPHRHTHTHSYSFSNRQFLRHPIEGSFLIERSCLFYDISYSMQATLVASRRSLHKRKGVLEVTHELVERLEAHLTASPQLMVCLMYILCVQYM
jgi:hypothetical protein